MSQVPSVLVDTGYSMSDERNAHDRLRPDVIAKNDWVLKAYESTNVDVVNVSSHDLRYFSSVLTKAELARRVASEPLLDRIVSANTISESAALASPRPYVIREVRSREGGAARPLRVAFIGLTETLPGPPPGFKLIDPADAAKRVAPEARQKADVVIALAKVTSEEAARIAREAPGIDVILAGNSVSLEQAFTPPFYVGQTLIAFTPFETRMLGEIRFYRGAQGKFTTKQRFIALDELTIPDDPSAKKFVDAAAAAEKQTQEDSKKLLDGWLASSRQRPNTKLEPTLNSKATYVTSAACSRCHVGQYMKLVNSAHVHATDPLPGRSAEFELSCLECHATGARTATINGIAVLTGLRSVQCEQCHGPGSEHIAKPAKGYGRVGDMNAACTACHTAEINPGFDVQTAWAKIKH